MGKRTFHDKLGQDNGPQYTRAEKLQRIRALIAQRKLPPWADPFFSVKHGTTKDRKEKAPDVVVDDFAMRVQKKKEFREWYLAKTGMDPPPQKENTSKDPECRVPAFREVKKFGMEEDGHDKAAGKMESAAERQMKSLEAKKLKIARMQVRHAKEREETLEKLYERLWRNSIDAEPLRCQEFKAHRTRAEKDQKELSALKRLDDLEDAEVDYYYDRIFQERIVKEREELDKVAAEHKEMELKGRDIVLDQIRERQELIEKDKERKAIEQQERLIEAEKLQYDIFTRHQEERRKHEQTKEFLLQQVAGNRMAELRKEEIKKEAENLKVYEQQLREEEEKARRATEEKKKAEYKKFVQMEEYNNALMVATLNTALDEMEQETIRGEQEDGLFNYLALTKTRQSQQRRVLAELDDQMRRKAETVKALQEAKTRDRMNALANHAEFLESERQKKITERQLCQANNRFLMEQMGERRAQLAKEEECTRNFSKYLENKRLVNERYIAEVSTQLAGQH